MHKSYFFFWLASRLIKIFSNLLKITCYAFHFFFPSKRFTIPEYSKALVKSKYPTKIPQVVFQTNYTNQVTLPIYLNYLFNRLMSINYDYKFFSHEKRFAFIRDNFPGDICAAYKKLMVGAAQADIWRLAVLYHCGGIYLDIDAQLVRPLATIIKKDDSEVYLYIRDKTISNYFLASQKANHRLKKAMDMAVKNIAEDKFGIWDMTGPGVLVKIIGDEKIRKENYKITCHQGNLTNQYFQYMDKPKAKWTHVPQDKIIKKEE